MSFEQFEIRTMDLKRASERDALESFLSGEDLTLEKDLDYAVCLMDGEKIIASGCAAVNVLKCIAVDASYQGQALTNKIISFLRIRAYHEGYSNLFLFTKPKNQRFFTELGFFVLASSPDALLMESSESGCESFLESLERPEKKGEAASLVMNCNPFTLGHRYLIDKACSENEIVHLFVVKEDLSVFPYTTRMKLVREGCADLKNLYIHEGQDYIISRATFPSYFIKEQKVLDESHARLDLDLFASRIAPALNITSRYVGEEPFCPVTSLYNNLMKEILPRKGIKVVEIPRKETADGAVSATKVRKALAEGRLEELKEWVPPTTFDFLASPEGRKIGDEIRQKQL